MSFTRPTLTTIIKRIRADFKSGLSLKAILTRSFLAVFAKAFGGASHTMHGHIDFAINKKFFPDTGDEATVIRWGSLYNLPRKDATFAELNIDVTGTTGGTLLEGAIYVRSDGLQYKVKAEVAVPAATTVDAIIVAQDTPGFTPGASGNMDAGDTISLQSPVAGIASEAVVDLTTPLAVEGIDLEPIEDYRVRVLQRMQFPPAGGTANDYLAFVLSVSGITRAWVLPGNRGEGSVDTTFVEDNDPVSIIPDAAKVAEVQLTVDDLKPVEVDHVAFAPIEFEMNPEIALKPNTTDTRAAVILELEDLLIREAEVRNAIDPLQVGLGIQFDGKIRLSQINESISIAAGETDHVLTSPTADVQPSEGGLVTLGTPVFSTLV